MKILVISIHYLLFTISTNADIGTQKFILYLITHYYIKVRLYFKCALNIIRLCGIGCVEQDSTLHHGKWRLWSPGITNQWCAHQSARCSGYKPHCATEIFMHNYHFTLHTIWVKPGPLRSFMWECSAPLSPLYSCWPIIRTWWGPPKRPNNWEPRVRNIRFTSKQAFIPQVAKKIVLYSQMTTYKDTFTFEWLVSDTLLSTCDEILGPIPRTLSYHSARNTVMCRWVQC